MAGKIALGSLRFFEAAARRGSFKLAANELSVTPGAVSRQIAALEERLGAQLFERRNREVVLTGPGRAYYDEVRAALGQIDAASAKIAKHPRNRIVRVDATPAIALHWLIPRLPRFDARHHGIEVELRTSVGPVPRGREIDWFVRRDPKDFKGLKGEVFLRERSRLMTSPQLARGLRLKRPEDVARCRVIENRARPDLWQKWCAAMGLGRPGFDDKIELDQTIYTIQAALEGVGVAVVPELFVSDLLAAGSLVCPLGEAPVVTGTYYLVSPRAQSSEAAAVFRRWARAEA